MKKKHLYRVHYILGYRSLTFSKSLFEKPIPGLILIDKKGNCELEIELGNCGNVDTYGNIKTYIYYNIQKDIFETEITVTKQLVSEETIRDFIKTYTFCGWKCETIKQDIEDLISFVKNNKINT